MRRLALPLLAVALAACAQPVGPPVCPHQATLLTTLAAGTGTGLTPWDMLALSGLPPEVRVDEPLATVQVDPIGNASGTHFTWLRFTSPTAADVKVEIEDEACGVEVETEFALAAPQAGKAPVAGQGAHVWYAGFWENGTLFGTNIEALDALPWPRADWYGEPVFEPLPVYVYDEDRSEQPPHWGDPTAGTPVAGSPAGMAGFGYYTTIEGFNEALKGAETTTTRVARLAPEEAYTLAGREDHPLYGDALVFLIQVEAVVDLPCPVGSPMQACSLP